MLSLFPKFLLSSFSLLAVLLPFTTFGSERPNVVVILVDDMGFSDLGCFGSEIKTPHIDQLAANGLRSTGFYNTSRCWPTRATLLSGNYRGDLKPDEPTIAEVALQAGYKTGMVGKWHLGNSKAYPVQPNDRSFEEFYGTLGGAGSFWEPPELMRNGAPTQPDSADYYYTDKTGSEAVRQIHQFAKTQQPFFLYVAFTAPHWPLHAPEASIQQYLHVYRDGWDALRKQRYQRMINMGLIDEQTWPLAPNEPEVRNWETVQNKEAHIRNMAVYAAMMDHLDQAVGEIVKALQETGQWNNTLVVFCSDNGASKEQMTGNPGSTSDKFRRAAEKEGRVVTIGNVPGVPNGNRDTFGSVDAGWAQAQNTPLPRFKANVRAGGSLTPAIFHWPAGIPHNLNGTVTDQPTHVVDLMATFSDLAKVDSPKTAGRSFVPLLQGKTLDKDFAYFFKHNKTRAIIQGGHKLVQEKTGPWQLYDLSQDKTESRDLAKLQPDRVAELEAQWEKLYQQVRYRGKP